MKFRPLFFLLSLPLLLAHFALAAPTLDERFLAAREAFRLGERAKLESIAPELKGYELDVYVDYWRLLADLKDADTAHIAGFLSRNEKAYVAEKLRGEWLKLLGKKQSWSNFESEYAKLEQPDQEVLCYALQSRRSRGDASMLDEAMPLWLTLLEPPEPCYPVLEALIVEKRVLADAVWLRIRHQFEANKMAAARYSMNYLPASQTPEAKVAEAVADKPLPWLAKLPASFWSGVASNASLNRMHRELAALAISRIARNDPRLAAEQLGKIEGRLQAGEKAWAWNQIAWQAAQRHLPETLDWYRQSGGEAPLSDEVAQWKVRAALRVQNWETVRSVIEKMPISLAGQPVWIYWLGRAYRAGGKAEEANTLFKKISAQPNFYSNLADDELERPIVTPPKAVAPSQAEMSEASANPALQRSLALLRLNLRIEGIKEWNWALRDMSDRQLLAASEVAQRANIYDRAIAAADRTKSEHDYSLRYLAPFGEQVRTAAKKQSLDDAWVYGLMRQESRFITTAKSNVGASGLMQLMPATAKWVAAKIGLKDFRQTQVNDTETNVLLGTTYMRLVLESLDNHPVLASAAYNAGPGRARRWRADRPLEGAIYAETIPFSETRDYVKKVMSNSVYYSALFDGKPQTIKHRLGVIAPHPGGEAKGEELP